jgi:SAM-dependent methyltransferase
MTKLKQISPISFYNSIAGHYNQQLIEEERDVKTRGTFARFFKQQVSRGRVLDFGGGTGLDLPWLLEAGFDVYFCEPAVKMREVAEEFVKQNVSKEKVVFLETEKTDFYTWNENNLPTGVPVDAILANFGVLNYIDDLTSLFGKFNLVIEKGGSVFISVLHPPLLKMMSKQFWSVVKAWYTGQKIKMSSQYNGQIHHALIHSIAELQKTSRQYFEFKTCQRLPSNSDFLIVHLIKR